MPFSSCSSLLYLPEVCSISRHNSTTIVNCGGFPQTSWEWQVGVRFSATTLHSNKNQLIDSENRKFLVVGLICRNRR